MANDLKLVWSANNSVEQVSRLRKSEKLKIKFIMFYLHQILDLTDNAKQEKSEECFCQYLRLYY
jgi:hypothetical protein